MMTEEELQKWIEEGKTPPHTDEADELSYKAVFRTLRNDEAPHVSSKFADQVIQAVEAKQKRTAKIEMIWMVLGIVIIVAASIGVLLWRGFQFAPGFLKELNDYKGIVVLASVILILIQVLDNKFVRPDAFAGSNKKGGV